MLPSCFPYFPLSQSKFPARTSLFPVLAGETDVSSATQVRTRIFIKFSQLLTQFYTSIFSFSQLHPICLIYSSEYAQYTKNIAQPTKLSLWGLRYFVYMTCICWHFLAQFAAIVKKKEKASSSCYYPQIFKRLRLL